jgi:hypothetical protein
LTRGFVGDAAKALEPLARFRAEARDAAPRFDDDDRRRAELGRVAHDGVELVSFAGRLQKRHRAARAHDRRPDVVNAAAHRASDLEDRRVRLARFARVEEQHRVALAEPVHARDVPRCALVEHELPRLEVVHGNAKHEETRSTGAL